MPHGPQIPVQPVEALANCLWTRKDAVPALLYHLLFVVARRAEEVQKRTLRRLQWESCIVPSAQHEHRNGHMCHEIERVSFPGMPHCERKTSGGQNRCLNALLYRRQECPLNPAQAVADGGRNFRATLR